MLFAGLLFAYWALRLAAPVWPPPLQPRLPVGVTALNTMILIASGLAVIAAVKGPSTGGRLRMLRGLVTAALLGGLFLAIHGYEWIRLVGFGMTVISSAYGSPFAVVAGFAGAIGAAIVAGWFLLLDLARGTPLLTPASSAPPCSMA